MAEGVLFNIAGGIIKSLAPLVGEEIGLLWNFQNDFENLEITVSTIKDVLLDAERQQTESHAVSGWLRKLNYLLYEADDFLDAISTDAQRQELMTQEKKAKKVRIFFSKSNQLIYSLRIGHKIREIGKRFDGIAASIKNFQFLVHPVEAPRDWKRNYTHSYLTEEILGRDDAEKNLKKLLMSKDKENSPIVSIFGLGGMGKTALAQSIFKDKEIETYFKLKMWVCVSDNFNVKDIIEKISMDAKKYLPKETQGDKENPKAKINEMGIGRHDEEASEGKKGPDNEMEKLMREILKTLEGMKGPDKVMEKSVRDLLEAIEGKRFLLVLDDVWEDGSALSYLKSLLKVGAKGSKTLITTRKKNVGTIVQAEQFQLDRLDDQASWELFKRVAFENEEESNSFEEKGKEILKKCGGVPLAVKTMGRLLYSKSLEKWQEYITKEFSQIPQQVDDILPTLKLSYNELPSHLKHCFAYCSLYQKNYEFDKVTLINLWIAQGYIELEENQCLEDIGNEYFMNLLWRSFFQEAQVDKFGNIIGCKMHDLMHDLAISVAGPLIIKFPSKQSINYKRTCHVAIPYNMSSSKLSPLHKASRIRTFLCPIADKSFDQVKIDYEIILKSFKFLRVLDLSGRKLKYVSSSISKLKHLRHLDLSWNKRIKKLPNSITTLVNLQNLCLHHCFELKKLPRFGKLVNLRHFDVSFCYMLRSLPRYITKLVNLRHLDIQGCQRIKCLPRGISQLTNLQLLTDFVVHSDSFSSHSSGVAELYGLNKLRGQLTIRGLIGGKTVLKEYMAANLSSKKNLNSLCLEWSTFRDVHDWDNDVSMDSLQPHQNLKCLELSNYCCPRYPTWLSSLTGLVSLSLNECSKWRVLEPLSHLSSLQSLKLYKMNDLEYISCGEWSDNSPSSVLRTFFPSLKRIDVEDCPNLNAWWGDSSPKFVSLLPLLESMRFFPSLTDLTVTKCPNLKGWWQDSSTEVESLLCSFPLLSRVRIVGCPRLTSMPKFSLLTESYLRCTNDRWKSLQQILVMSVSVTIASSPIFGSLRTHLSKLKEINFHSVSDLEALPEEGLQSLTSLKILKFVKCAKLKSLSPGIKYVTSLQNLSIWECPVFTDEEDGGMQWKYLKSLLSLSFRSLPKLSSLPIGLQYVTTLKTLSIWECESFTTLSPLLQHLPVIEELDIGKCSVCIDDVDGMQWQSLRCLLSLSLSDHPQLSSLPLGLQHVTTLQNLSISNCENFTTVKAFLPDLQHVTTLRKLTISYCESLTVLSPVIKHFPTVEELYIRGCPMRADDKNEMQWHCLKSLLSLSFEDIPKLSSLPLGLRHVTTLRELKIVGCDRMRTIPKWIRQCKSLEMLTIGWCSKLRSLPVGSREPWSLQMLGIQGCPLLLRKCEREKGKYWAKIAHIPDLKLERPLERVSVHRRVLWKCERVHRRVILKCKRVRRRTQKFGSESESDY